MHPPCTRSIGNELFSCHSSSAAATNVVSRQLTRFVSGRIVDRSVPRAACWTVTQPVSQRWGKSLSHRPTLVVRTGMTIGFVNLWLVDPLVVCA